MKLVDEWRSAWKWLSVWVFTVIGISPDIYAYMASVGWLSDGSIPAPYVWAIRGLSLAGVIGRLKKQWKDDHPKAPEP